MGEEERDDDFDDDERKKKGCRRRVIVSPVCHSARVSRVLGGAQSRARLRREFSVVGTGAFPVVRRGDAGVGAEREIRAEVVRVRDFTRVDWFSAEIRVRVPRERDGGRVLCDAIRVGDIFSQRRRVFNERVLEDRTKSRSDGPFSRDFWHGELRGSDVDAVE